MKNDTTQLSRLALTVRMLAADAVQKANSGHPGMPMGAADYASVLFANVLRFNPRDPHWANRDRFVLSAGHGSMLLYSMLHLFGYALALDELKRFRQWGSITPGHPEFGVTPGVETTTGPLGQGFSNGVGLALSGKMLQARYSEELFNYRVYGIVSDGDLMEGVASEAASLAGHLGLNNLIYFYDDNQISIGGSTSVCFTESVPKRFEAYGWFVQSVDGHNMQQITEAVERAQKEPSRPSIICCRTTIGFGSPNRAGSAKVHGEPLGEEELKLTKEKLGWPTDQQFFIPEDVRAFCSTVVEGKAREHASWQQAFSAWSAANPEKAKQYQAQANRTVPSELRGELFKVFADRKKKGSRELSGDALQVIAKHVPALVGGSADLEPSTKTLIKDTTDVQRGAFAGRNLRFGVREHGMGAIANGLAYTQSWIPYTATFLVFADYMRPTVRLAALSHLQTLFIFTHDSFWVGEDGPTHEPIEQICSLRIIPNLHVHRPADGLEVALSYEAALTRKNGPAALLFTRQGVPALDRDPGCNVEDALKGGYVVRGTANSELTLVATGSEVWVALEAAKQLESTGIKARVVSMPCVELFLQQDQSYRDQVIPPSSRKVSIEAGITTGWERIVGRDGLKIGIDHYGASAPGEVLAEKFGFTPAGVLVRVKEWLGR